MRRAPLDARRQPDVQRCEGTRTVSGLVGFVKPAASTEDAEALVTRMVAWLEPQLRPRTSTHHETGVGLGHVGLGLPGSEPRLAWSADETLCLAFAGELHDVATHERLWDQAGQAQPSRSPADLALRLYQRVGESFVEQCNGVFALALWDRRARRLILANDRLGLYPLYYAQVNRDLLFGTGVRALLADPSLNRCVDRVAMNQFLVFDHLLDDRTLLTSVRLCPQGSILTFEAGRVAVRQYWRPQYQDVCEPRSEAAWIEQFMHHLQQAVARQRTDGQSAGLLMSGGLDSRLLAALLCGSSGAPVQTFTFGIPGCDDARYAKEVAEQLGFQHRFFELRPDWLRHLAHEAVRLTDGLGNVVNLHALATLEEETRHAKVIYKGFLGDALLGFALKRQMWADYRSDDRPAVHLGVHDEQGVVNYTRAQQRALFTDTFQRDVRDAVYESYAAALSRSGATQLAHQRLYFDLTQRVPRMTINGVQVVRSRAIVRLPFSDNDLVAFALTVPPGFLFERYLAKAAFVRAFPALAQIPLAGSNRPLSFCARDLAIQLRQLLSWHLGRLGLRRTAGVAPRPYKDYNTWFRTTLRSWVEDILLTARALDRGYFKPEWVRALVAEHMAGVNHGGRLGALLTLELWHRQYLD